MQAARTMARLAMTEPAAEQHSALANLKRIRASAAKEAKAHNNLVACFTRSASGSSGTFDNRRRDEHWRGGRDEHGRFGRAHTRDRGENDARSERRSQREEGQRRDRAPRQREGDARDSRDNRPDEQSFRTSRRQRGNNRPEGARAAPSGSDTEGTFQ